jgi:ATP-binding cassette, subfamily B, multidrug efflux pump
LRDLPRFLRYFTSRPGAYAAGFGTMIGSALLFLAMPIIVRRALEALDHGVTAGRLAQASGVIVLLALGDAGCLFLTRRIIIGASRDIEYEMRRDLFAHLLRLPPVWYRNQRVGDLMSRAVNDLSAVRMLLGPGIMQAANTVIVGAIALALMFRVSTALTLVSLALFPLVALATKFVGQATHRRFTGIQEFFSEISNSAQENFSGVRLVRAFAKESVEEARFAERNLEFKKRNLGLARLNALYFPMLQLLVGAGFAFVLYVGGRFILEGTLTVPRFVEFNLYMIELIWPAIALGWVVNLWQRGTASWKRMLDLWEAPPMADEADTGETLAGDLTFHDLRFAYGADVASAASAAPRAILDGVSFHVQAADTLAVVGRTGAGKSTLLNLLLRIDEPPAGAIRIGGRDIRTIPLPTLRRNVVAVPQETFLFSDTLAANIAFGNTSISRAEIEQAARAAGLGPDLATFAKGLDTIVGERGITLSGGQKQRTALARALASQAPVLILDDAFSSVDTETEARILDSLRAAVTGRTVLLISHRLSTVRQADRIIVLHEGRVAESGTHEELLAHGGLYTALAERQRLEAEVEAA